MIVVAMYSKTNEEGGIVTCQEVQKYGRKSLLVDIEDIQGTIDIVDIFHHPDKSVSFEVLSEDLIAYYSLLKKTPGPSRSR